jgi:septal ring factor EnvC (AmiA/AmiB activator)
MKKYFYVLLIPVLLLASGCNQKKIDRLQAQNDSLRAVGTDKDSNISEFVSTFNDIEANLDSIKKAELVIDKNAKAGEVKGSRKEQIKSDIKYIYDLQQKNRKMVAELSAKLSKSGRHAAQLQKMIDNLNASIAEKDVQIAQMTDELGKLNIQVKDLNVKVVDLNTNVDNLSADNAKKQADIDAKTAALNTAYYVIGTNRELKDKKIITGEGGFIGIGRTKDIMADLNMNDFTKVDITVVNEIPIMKKKISIITSHPKGSYRLEGDKTVDKLVIVDAKAFWSLSKVLVITAK